MDVTSDSREDRWTKIAEENCSRNISVLESSFKNGNFCKRVFDGLFCWPLTPAGELAVQPCVNAFLTAVEKNETASKQCLENGMWYMDNTSKLWTNTLKCGKFALIFDTPIEDHLYTEWVPIIKNVSYSGYAISMLTALFAVAIFTSIKRLHCARNKLHTHLFISFILRGIMLLIKDTLFVKGTALSNDIDYIGEEPHFKQGNYSWICKALTSIRWYFTITNFMFILMEGIYLHNLMFLKLFSYKNSVLVYCVIGWGTPVLFIIPWIVLKILQEDEYCWTQRKLQYIAWLIDGPIAFTVIINFFLFLVITRVLFIKINSICVLQRKAKYRKLLKSTLILILLFGVPYSVSLILYFYVNENVILELIWLFFDQTVSAFQGFFAVLLYCLLNGEVQAELRRKYHSVKERHNNEFRRSRTISQTQQFSIQTNEELEQIHLGKENGFTMNVQETVN